MDNFEYHFKSDFIRIRLYDMEDKPLSISRFLGSKYSKKFKTQLNEVSILDDAVICQTIVSCMPKFDNTKYIAIPVPLELYGAGLSYYISDVNSNKYIYRFVIYTCDPNLDLSWILS